jgi:hypothetical protein
LPVDFGEEGGSVEGWRGGARGRGGDVKRFCYLLANLIAGVVLVLLIDRGGLCCR